MAGIHTRGFPLRAGRFFECGQQGLQGCARRRAIRYKKFAIEDRLRKDKTTGFSI